MVFVGGLDWISDLIAGREDSFPRTSTGHLARTDFIRTTSLTAAANAITVGGLQRSLIYQRVN